MSKSFACILWLSTSLGLGAQALMAQGEAQTPPAATDPGVRSAPSAPSQPTPGAPVNPPSAEDVDKVVKYPWIPVSYAVTLLHYYGFRSEVDPFTVATLGASWAAGAYDLGLSQNLTKYYFIASGDAEVQGADTILSVGRPWSEEIYGFKGYTLLSLTLPVSEFSRDHKVLTKPRVGLSFSRAFLDERLNYTLGAGFQYNVNRYTTTRTGTGLGGGTPLRRMSYSIDNSLSYKIFEKFSADVAISYIQVYYHDLGLRNRQTTATGDALLNTNYSAGFGLSYELIKELSISGGYSQSDVVEKTGGVNEAYLFDPYTTQWYVGLSSSF